jgi:hypothetical protein
MPIMDPLDAYSPLGHYMMVSNVSYRPAASWVPEEDRRRLAAYFVLDSFRKNSTRNLLRRATWVRRQKQREYGTPSLLTKRIRSGVLGEDFEWTLPGADDDLGDAPDLPPKPDKPEGEDVDDIENRVYDIALARWKEAAERIVDEWEQATALQPELQAMQTALRKWADRIQLAPLMVEAEDDCVNLGDTIYALFPKKADWPRVEIYEPDGYFPVLDTKRDGYVTKLHLAWEIEEEAADGTTKTRLERYTWELVDIASMRETDPDGELETVAGERQTVDEDGVVRTGRQYPWTVAPEDEIEGEPPAPPLATETCLFTRGVWELEAHTLSKVPDLSEGAALRLERTDLQCDFIPVIHVPNTPASRDHFGQGSRARGAQLLDDIGQLDTDLMETARLVAAPAIALSGAESKDQTIRPLTIFNLGKDGKMELLDLSDGIEKVMAFGAWLEDRLYVNSQVPATLVGKVNSSDAPSGISLLLDAAPFAQLIGTLRMAREPKYRLLPKFAMRMAQTAGVLPAGATPEAFCSFGSFLPLDKGQVVEYVTALLSAKAISRSTAISLLVAGGFPIEDARREVTQIESEDFEGAKLLAEALASEPAAAEYLHRVVPEPAEPEAPTVELPPGPGGQPPQPPPPGPGGTPPNPPQPPVA